jgi:glutathione S-transferase
MPILHGAIASPFVRKVRVALACKGIDYKQDPIIPLNVSPEYKQKSPLGKIPCFEDGDFVLPDSSCIIAYLEKVKPSPALYPSDAKHYGRALWYEEYADTKLSETVGPIFFERFVKKNVLKAQPDEERVRKQIAEALPPVLDYLEGEVPARGDAIVGGSFSIADIALGSQLLNLVHAGVGVDRARWPNLAAYTAAVHGNAWFAPLVAEERAAFGIG